MHSQESPWTAAEECSPCELQNLPGRARIYLGRFAGKGGEVLAFDLVEQAARRAHGVVAAVKMQDFAGDA